MKCDWWNVKCENRHGKLNIDIYREPLLVVAVAAAVAVAIANSMDSCSLRRRHIRPCDGDIRAVYYGRTVTGARKTFREQHFDFPHWLLSSSASTISRFVHIPVLNWCVMRLTNDNWLTKPFSGQAFDSCSCVNHNRHGEILMNFYAERASLWGRKIYLFFFFFFWCFCFVNRNGNSWWLQIDH